MEPLLARDFMSDPVEGFELEGRGGTGRFSTGRIFWDEAFDALFDPVLEARALFDQARFDRNLGSALLISSLGTAFLGLVVLGITAMAPAALFLPLIIVAASVVGASVPLLLTGMRHTKTATLEAREAVAIYNRSLETVPVLSF